MLLLLTIFQMEKNISYTFLFLICLICLTKATTNYFQGLNIDPNLINNANNAIIDLKNTLANYLDCLDQDKNSDNQRSRPDGNLRGSHFVQKRQNKKLKRIHYNNSFGYTQPNIKLSKSKKYIASDLYKKVTLVAELLSQVKNYIIQYNNVIIGNNNVVNGSGNIIIGSQNSLTGSNDWVFASDYQSTNPQDGVLVIQVFLIELADMFDILTDPLRVVSCVNQRDSNKHFQSWWNGADNHHRATF